MLVAWGSVTATWVQAGSILPIPHKVTLGSRLPATRALEEAALLSPGNLSTTGHPKSYTHHLHLHCTCFEGL